MHSSTGSPSPTCSHNDRASISTPPPSSSPAFANSSVPNSPGPTTNNDHPQEWLAPSRGGNMDADLVSMSLRHDPALLGLGFNDGSARPSPHTSFASSSAGSDSDSNAIGTIISLYSSSPPSSSPALTAVASPAMSASPTPTAYASAMPSPSIGSATAESASPALLGMAGTVAAALGGAESGISAESPEVRTSSSSFESGTPSPSESMSTASSLSASPTFTTVASATVSPATKFVLSPVLSSASPATSAVAGSPSTANMPSHTTANAVALTSPAFGYPSSVNSSSAITCSPALSTSPAINTVSATNSSAVATTPDSASLGTASQTTPSQQHLVPPASSTLSTGNNSGAFGFVPPQLLSPGSPTPHATAVSSPNLDPQDSTPDAVKESSGHALQSPLALLNSKAPSLRESFVFNAVPREDSQLSNAAFDTSAGMSAADDTLPVVCGTHDTSSSAPYAPSVASSAASGQSFQDTDGSEQSYKTPNVYINGLPPNFPEEQLFNMTKEFGPVVSVRTFTRHVSERPTGYGFVLFETLEGAEKCIGALRKYRNLHPSFSKQIHKIPGTMYSNVDVAQAAAGSGGGDGSAVGGQDENSFKMRMEKLKDTTSSNLYIEGLPLSIDEPTLTALVSPHAIKSSRFFQTKLSHPPRIIAFVRLETRAACEEIIERLHGRMVRGWNDPGCRISVRFADSNEQRELRKRERAKREGGDGSPNRLTMAQAALLNLRGSEMKSRGAGLGTDVLSPMAVQTPVNQLMAAQNLSQHPMTAQYQQQRDMQLLLDSLKNGGMGLGGGLGHRAGNLLPGSVDVNTLLAAQELNNWNGLGSAQAGPGGFTAAEQLLLQAHAQAKARLGASPTLPLAGLPQAALNRGLGRGHLDFAGGVASPNLRNYAQLGSPVLDVLSGLPEQELHGVPAALSQRLQSQGQGRLQNHRGAERGYGALRSSVDLDLDSIRFGQVAGERRGSTTNDPLVAQRQVSQGRPQPSSLHMRATTLPASYVGNHRSGGALDAAGKASLNSGPGTRGNNLKIDHAASNANSGGDKDQSPAVSPALTYASRTPSSTSFSPATPYFNAGFEGYENVGVSVGGGDQSPAGLGLSMMNAVAGNVGGKGKGRAVN